MPAVGGGECRYGSMTSDDAEKRVREFIDYIEAGDFELEYEVDSCGVDYFGEMFAEDAKALHVLLAELARLRGLLEASLTIGGGVEYEQLQATIRTELEGE